MHEWPVISNVISRKIPATLIAIIDCVHGRAHLKKHAPVQGERKCERCWRGRLLRRAQTRWEQLSLRASTGPLPSPGKLEQVIIFMLAPLQISFILSVFGVRYRWAHLHEGIVEKAMSIILKSQLGLIQSFPFKSCLLVTTCVDQNESLPQLPKNAHTQVY